MKDTPLNNEEIILSRKDVFDKINNEYNEYYRYLSDKNISRISLPKDLQELNDFAYGLEEYLGRRALCKVNFIGINESYGYGYHIKLTSKILSYEQVLLTVYIDQSKEKTRIYAYNEEHDVIDEIFNLKKRLFVLIDNLEKSGILSYLKSV
jgi:hypothetical protein